MPWMLLAATSLQEGQPVRAATYARRRIAEARTDGDAWHLLGAALLAAGRWSAAHDAWRAGAEAAPAHAALRVQLHKDEMYSLAPKLDATPEPRGLDTPPLVERQVQVRGARAILLSNRLFGHEECGWAIRQAEEYSKRSGGWTTSRCSRRSEFPPRPVPRTALPHSLSA